MLSLPGSRRSLFGRSGRGRRSLLARIDWMLWGVPMGMVALAGVLIASTQRQASYADWYQHWITGIVGLGVALLLARLPLERLHPWRWPIYIAIVCGLLAVQVVGTSALGAQSWINIGGFYLQPSEFAKLGVIVLLAGVLARHPVERPVDLVRPTALIGLPWLLVFIEPDLGSSLVFGAVLLVMLFWAGMPGAWLVLLLSPLITAVLAGTLPWLLIGWIPLMGWLAWWGPVEPLPVTAPRQVVEEQAASVALVPCGICGGGVAPDVLQECVHRCGQTFHKGCYQARMSVYRGDPRFCGVCNARVG